MDNKRQTFRQDIAMPVEMRVSGMPVTVHGTLMDISAEGGRARSLIALEKNAVIRFDIRSGNAKTLELRGRIASRKKIVGQAFYEYGIAFDKISTADSDALVAFIMEFQRRAAADRTETKDAAVADAKPGQKRGAYRALVAFPIKYRRDGRPGATIAEANDLSAGGLRLICTEPMPRDVILTLEFTLPNEVLTVFSSHVPEDPSPFGGRGITRPKPKDPHRAFEPMTVRGKVAARLQDSSGRIVLGIQFIDADAFMREEIQRYIHAVQLYKIRTSVDNL
ncbi:MAG: PilZ domain-containing protein [Candidatus Eremiobacteraeota bacterium]|nr:PilZ domain-containing protein [Candidatus Eremiobacteraeota bacterium]